MKIGFTGTRRGMTSRQRAALQGILPRLLDDKWPSEFHHGCCVGADAEAHHIAVAVTSGVVGHPMVPDDQQAELTGFLSMNEAKPPLERNRDIVDRCTLLMAAPSGTEEIKRGSGTWATIRYARSIGRATLMLWP